MSEPIQLTFKKVFPAHKWKVLRMLANVQNFPKFMPNVRQCTVFEKTPEGVITAWNVEVDKIPLSWKEIDVLDIPNAVMRFRAIEGDFECFEGEWILHDFPPSGTEVELKVKVKIGIPLVDHVIVGKTPENFISLKQLGLVSN